MGFHGLWALMCWDNRRESWPLNGEENDRLNGLDVNGSLLDLTSVDVKVGC